MCELLGISAKQRRAFNAVLREFFSHAEQNPHGWGLARFTEAGESRMPRPLIDKEPCKATTSERLHGLLSACIEDRALLAHIRFASIGHPEYANCHPFTAADSYGRSWTLIHNGTIFHGESLNEYLGVQSGSTDSERVLLYLVDRIDRAQARTGRPLDANERFDVLASAVAALADGNKLNLLVCDGEVMYVHTNLRGTLHYSHDGDALIFSTKPLSTGMWTPVPFMRLLAVQNGAFIREATPHGHEYVYDPEDYRYVYMDYAML